MAEEKDKGITVSKQDDMAEWYAQVCLKSELADYGTVKGTIVIRPLGYSLWENIQNVFNKLIKAHGVKNAYFPLFIPERFFKLESQHAKGFSPEVAWLDKKVTGEGDRLAIRPTSETIMYDSYSRWIRSYRDLPLLINQWCNVVRWETEATKLFLRSREFLWQEGHCVYATAEELEKDTLYYLELYRQLIEESLAISLLVERKTDKEKFAGANTTYSVEAFMPDGKALQAGTSHNLGQNFAKAFNIKFIGKDEKEHLGWQNSWGISTRLIGALVMTHGDDKGLVLPPRIAPNKLVIVPIFAKDRKKIIAEAKKLEASLKEFSPILDDRDEYTPGWKFNEWELKGVPLRVELGPRDLAAKQAIVVRRDTGEKKAVKLSQLKKEIPKILDEIQKNLFSKSKKFMLGSIVEVKDMKSLIQAIKEKKIAKANFCNKTECEEWIKEKTGGATIRGIPLGSQKPSGKCVHCNKPAKVWVHIAKAY
jgi:prolyl-tRNA synthetase